MISPARKAAIAGLQCWRQKGKVIFPSISRPEDAKLAERIVQGVMHNERFLDACIAKYMSAGFSRLHPQTLDLLRMSAYQILFLDRVPDSAAVHDAVSICRNGALAYSAGFVNAVLRKVSAEKENLLSLDFPLAVRFSISDWLADSLVNHYGDEFVRQFLSASQEAPRLRVQINTQRCSLSEYISLLNDAGIDILSVNFFLSSVELDSFPVEKLPGYHEGLFYIQDDAARSTVRLAAVKPNMQVLDVCAAPGGKSIAAALDGGRVLAWDQNETRLRLCRENFSRLKMKIGIEQMDARTWRPELEGQFDLVIADVPCSGTGVIRKHAEIRHRKESDVLKLIVLQKEILDTVHQYVRKGGTLLYSTCSILPEENEDQVQRFLQAHPEFSLEPASVEGFNCENGMLYSWPQSNKNDGFFAAKMRKSND